MCDLTTTWILESAQRLSVRTYHNMDLNCSQTLARERHAHRWPSMVRGAMLARPTRRAWGYCDSSGERGTQLSAWERSQPLRRERHAHKWPSMVRGAMLARPTRRAWGCCDSSGEQGTQLSAREGTQTLRRERHAHRWPSTVREAMLATTWNLSSPPVATILAGEHSRQGLREMLLKTPRGEQSLS